MAYGESLSTTIDFTLISLYAIRSVFQKALTKLPIIMHGGKYRHVHNLNCYLYIKTASLCFHEKLTY